MKNRSHDSRTDELNLVVETLKDLTPSAAVADEVRGGKTSSRQACYCGTM